MEPVAALFRKIPLGFIAVLGSAATATCALLAVHAYQPTQNWVSCTHPLHPHVRQPGKAYALCHIRDEHMWTTHPHQTAAIVFLGMAIAAALLTACVTVCALRGLASPTKVSRTPGPLN